MIWTFHESGVVPALAAGPFSNCRVDVHEDGTYTILPLAQQPHLEPAPDAPTADTTASVEQAQPEQASAAETPEQ